MTAGSFIHLHTHSEYSLLNACLRIEDIVQKCKNFGMSSVALTDYGNMFGAISFYKEATAHGIRPILGMDAHMSPGSRLDRKLKEGRAAFNMVLLARNAKGYKNLIKLSSIGYLEGFYYKPRIDDEVLAKHSDGLIGICGAPGSEIGHHLILDNFDQALERAQFFKELFGKDNFYLEITDSGLEEQGKVRAGILEISKKTKIPIVASNDVHFGERDDALAYEIMVCIGRGHSFGDAHRFRAPSQEQYFKNSEQMKSLFHDLPEAVENTRAIAERCHVELDFSTHHLPKFSPPEGYTSREYLRHLCEEGLARKFKPLAQDARERLNYELGVIEKMGFVDYFLIVWDFIRYAQEIKVPVGPGRGSAAGSIVSYSLNITQLDPLKYGLLFERFLNPSRISMPDIDIDFCRDGRGSIIDYVNKKYGSDSVAQIITFGTMKAKGSIRDVGRVMDIPLKQVDRIAKLVPNDLGITLNDALKKEPELTDLYNTDAEVHDLIDIARKIEGMARHASIHAAGVVISDGPLTERVPLYRKDEDITTQFPMEAVEHIGLLKMDFLGLNTLTIIDKALKYIQENHGKDIDFDQLGTDDEKTYDLLCRGETKGVFQVESSGMTDLVQKLKPRRLEDLCYLMALFRPGPLQSGLVDNFIQRRHGREEVTYLHPVLKPILEETYGVFLYQEQVMSVANKMAGFTLPEADNLRKAMGKKKPEIMAKFKESFIKGSLENKIPKDIAEETFQQMEYFAGYGFNKSHSMAYSILTYRTAYLKANYSVEFMAALMTCDMGNTDKIVEYIGDCRSMGLDVLPPDVQSGHVQYKPKGNSIHYGLGAIKGVGEKAVESILEAREKLGGKFSSLHEFCENVDLRLVNKAVIDSLIKSGSMDNLYPDQAKKPTRAALSASLDDAMRVGASAQADRRRGQKNMFGAFGADDENQPAELAEAPEWEEADLLRFEKETVGFYISRHPLANFADLIKRFSSLSCSAVGDCSDGQEIILGAMISHVKMLTTKKGDQMARLTLEDLTGSLEAIIFAKLLREQKNLIEEDRIHFFKGRLDMARETPSLIVNEIIPLDSALGRLSSMVKIKIITTGFESDQLAALKQIIRSHPGKCEAYLEFHGRGGTKTLMKLPDDHRVEPSQDFISIVSSLLGPGHVQCLK